MAENLLSVRLAYGEHGLDVELPADRTTVVEPTYAAAAEDQRGLLRRRPAGAGRRAAAARAGEARASRSRSRCATAPGRSRGT